MARVGWPWPAAAESMGNVHLARGWHQLGKGRAQAARPRACVAHGGAAPAAAAVTGQWVQGERRTTDKVVEHTVGRKGGQR